MSVTAVPFDASAPIPGVPVIILREGLAEVAEHLGLELHEHDDSNGLGPLQIAVAEQDGMRFSIEYHEHRSEPGTYVCLFEWQVSFENVLKLKALFETGGFHCQWIMPGDAVENSERLWTYLIAAEKRRRRLQFWKRDELPLWLRD